MEKKLKLILEFWGIMISSISLALLVFNEYYLVSVFALILLVFLLYLAYKTAKSKPYHIKRVEYLYEFCDKSAYLTKVSKITLLVPKEKNVTKIEDFGITADGKIKSISSNAGITSIKKKGGFLAITTNFDVPLEIGKEYSHIVSYEGENCFPEKNENIIFAIIYSMNEAKISVTFHKDKRPFNFKVMQRLSGGRYKELTTSSNVEVKDLKYTLTYKSPPVGSIFEFQWNW